MESREPEQDLTMALYLPKTKTLYVHIPKCGGHWVEEVLKKCGIEYRHAKPKPGVCPRHGKVTDYDEDVENSFTTLRDEKSWMRSYWAFHMSGRNNRLSWDPSITYEHKFLGPPLSSWQEWSKNTGIRGYLATMKAGVDRILDADWDVGMTELLYDLGHEVTLAQVSSVPRSNVTVLKVELGGGTKGKGEGFTNVDIDPKADFIWNLDEPQLPFPDASVDEVYSSHCMEHLKDPNGTFLELARICKPGAPVEIRVPHPASHMAMCPGHYHTISPLMVENMDEHFPKEYWAGRPRRLKLQSLTYHPTTWLGRARVELPFLAGIDDQTVMRWIPNACHESVFVFEVQING